MNTMQHFVQQAVTKYTFACWWPDRPREKIKTKINYPRKSWIEVTEKKCMDCGEVKPISQYHIHKDSKDMHQPRCKPCSKIYQHKYYQAKKEKMNANIRQN